MQRLRIDKLLGPQKVADVADAIADMERYIPRHAKMAMLDLVLAWARVDTTIAQLATAAFNMDPTVGAIGRSFGKLAVEVIPIAVMKKRRHSRGTSTKKRWRCWMSNGSGKTKTRPGGMRTYLPAPSMTGFPTPPAISLSHGRACWTGRSCVQRVAVCSHDPIVVGPRRYRVEEPQIVRVLPRHRRLAYVTLRRQVGGGRQDSFGGDGGIFISRSATGGDHVAIANRVIHALQQQAADRGVLVDRHRHPRIAIPPVMSETFSPVIAGKRIVPPEPSTTGLVAFASQKRPSAGSDGDSAKGRANAAAVQFYRRSDLKVASNSVVVIELDDPLLAAFQATQADGGAINRARLRPQPYPLARRIARL
ncbi:unnamed protein product [Acanthosepion pharaonis]|uniref:Uncharacterized protein n=1 Tax=Acanthosepion pharaonis TaxID=158019 RepID=A0A812DMC7_ACAPH|nr:unnamed protein product [Sepia pharaonis]